MTVLLDTHVLHWVSFAPERLSKRASASVADSDDLAIAAITWYELAWLATNERIGLSIPIDTWLGRLSAQVRTVGITPSIARTAAALPSTFPGDPADRLIYATALETGCELVTKDERMRKFPHPRRIAIW